MVALRAIDRRPTAGREENGHGHRQWIAAEDLDVDLSKMQVSETDVAVDIVGVAKWYGEFHVLNDINLRMMRGERIVICGQDDDCPLHQPPRDP